MALPSLLVVALALAVWVVACVGAQLRCVDAARAAARVAARGDTDALSTRAGRALAPPGSTVHLRTAGALVTAEVSADFRSFGSALHLPALHVQARAVADREDVPADGAP